MLLNAASWSSDSCGSPNLSVGKPASMPRMEVAPRSLAGKCLAYFGLSEIERAGMILAYNLLKPGATLVIASRPSRAGGRSLAPACLKF